METSVYPPASHHHHQQPHQLPSPTSHVSSSSSSNGQTTPLTPNSPYPTTFVQADTASFKQVVQMLTGSPRPRPTTTTQPDPPVSNRSGPHHHSIPPIKSIPNKKASNSSGFKLYERRNSLKNFKINPIFAPGSGSGSGFFSPGDILSPSILDFPSLALSPVTPLVPDPFPSSDEEKAIKEKGFYLHPSPATTPRDSSGGSEPPRLLPLFPVTSPRVSSAVERQEDNWGKESGPSNLAGFFFPKWRRKMPSWGVKAIIFNGISTSDFFITSHHHHPYHLVLVHRKPGLNFFLALSWSLVLD